MGEIFPCKQPAAPSPDPEGQPKREGVGQSKAACVRGHHFARGVWSAEGARDIATGEGYARTVTAASPLQTPTRAIIFDRPRNMIWE